MIFQEPVYDLYTLAEYNLHIHTVYSGCAKPDMHLPDILRTAESHGLKVIALTDHYNDADGAEDFICHIDRLRRETAAAHTRVRVLFGAELSAYARGKTLETAAVRETLDYCLYSCNHYHLDFWEQPEDTSTRGYALHAYAVIRSLIESGKADCIAHPLIGRFVKLYEDCTLIPKALTDNELGDLLQLSNRRRVAWELNVGAIFGDPSLARRLWTLGRENSVVFHFGTDAHTLINIDTRQFLPRLEDILNTSAT